MTVTYAPLESKAGFASPNFSVDQTGNLVAQSIQADSFTSSGTSITLGNIALADNYFANDFVDSSIGTVNNSLLRFTTNVELSINNGQDKFDLTAKDLYAFSLTSPSGSLTIETTDAPLYLKSNFRTTLQQSPLRFADFDNTTRASITPLFGDVIYNTDTNSLNFYNGTGWKSINSMGNITVNGTTITAGTGEDISIIPQTGGKVIFDDITINNQPVLNEHGTRKDYVDRKIAAFAIAFGA